jgi:hypothetical protein
MELGKGVPTGKQHLEMEKIGLGKKEQNKRCSQILFNGLLSCSLT